MTRVFTPQHHATIYQTFAINFGLKLISLDPITFSAFLGCKSDDQLCFILLSCDTDFELYNDNMARFQLLCVTYVYRCCNGFNCQWTRILSKVLLYLNIELTVNYWIISLFCFVSFLKNCIFLLIVTLSFDILFVQLYSPNGGK